MKDRSGKFVDIVILDHQRMRFECILPVRVMI